MKHCAGVLHSTVDYVSSIIELLIYIKRFHAGSRKPTCGFKTFGKDFQMAIEE
jgi:hypothetical protein